MNTNTELVVAFVQECVNLTNDEIYNKFEDAPDAVRDAILAHADSNSNEPVRNALNKLGEQHNIKSLAEY